MSPDQERPDHAVQAQPRTDHLTHVSKNLLRAALQSADCANVFLLLAVARKQCIDSEGLFDFLRGLAEQTTTAAEQSDSGGMSVWQMFRSTLSSSINELRTFFLNRELVKSEFLDE